MKRKAEKKLEKILAYTVTVVMVKQSLVRLEIGVS